MSVALDWDFKGLADLLLSRAREFVPEVLPGGRMEGREYVCANVHGGVGHSMKVNLDTGRWADFSTDDCKGLDLISLYAKVEGLKMGDAAKALAERYRYALVPAKEDKPKPKPAQIEDKSDPQIVKPPANVAPPLMTHPRFGQPVRKWVYPDPNGEPLFYIARHEPKGERKQFVPWSWDSRSSKWVMKSYPAPRPLYGLDRLADSPAKPVLVVEGEKAADAARGIAPPYVVVTWPGGAKATGKTDLTPLHGRHVLLWPDADDAGRDAMAAIAAALEGKCPEVKLIDVTGQPDGWDAADAVTAEWDWTKLVEWAKPRAHAWGWRPEPPAPVVEEGQVIPPASATETESEPGDVTVEEPEETNVSREATWEKLGIAQNHNGHPFTNLDNALRVLEGWPEFESIAWFDVFHQRILTKWNSDDVREWSDIHDLRLAKYMQRRIGLTSMGDDLVHKAITEYAHNRKRNEPRDWMEGLTWDGKPRVDGFLSEYLGAEVGIYARGASRNFWIGMVARIYRPGCKLDNMIILEGPQGRFKSTALGIIGGPWYAEAHGTSVTGKDFYLVLHGKILVEIGEMSAFSKAEQATIKQVVSCATDRYRTPYGRTAEDHPRMNVFVGSTNDKEHLGDPTGARRFWPVECGVIDKDKLAEDRTQLFAEAVARFKKGEPWYEMPVEATAIEQEKRRRIDEWEPIIAEFVYNRHVVSVVEIAEHLKIEKSRLGMMESRRIANCLRLLKWDKRTTRKEYGTCKMWYPPDAAELPIDGAGDAQEDAPF